MIFAFVKWILILWSIVQINRPMKSIEMKFLEVILLSGFSSHTWSNPLRFWLILISNSLFIDFPFSFLFCRFQWLLRRSTHLHVFTDETRAETPNIRWLTYVSKNCWGELCTSIRYNIVCCSCYHLKWNKYLCVKNECEYSLGAVRLPNKKFTEIYNLKLWAFLMFVRGKYTNMEHTLIEWNYFELNRRGGSTSSFAGACSAVRNWN